jgi:UPF0271 protein
MKFISSANIACGFHAGDVETMKKTVDCAIKNKVAIGAHPSYPDRENFGRIDLLEDGLELKELPGILRRQIEALLDVCRLAGCRMHHLKPHGALYNRSARDREVSDVIVKTILEYDSHWILYGMSGSEMKAAAAHWGLPFRSEVFADRGYTDEGSLVPRNMEGALLRSPEKVFDQALTMVLESRVKSISGKMIPVVAETLCIHGDGPQALEFARVIHNGFADHGITINSTHAG